MCVRSVAQLALSFDHRVVDGELASRFLADVGALLEDPTGPRLVLTPPARRSASSRRHGLAGRAGLLRRGGAGPR